MQIYTYTFTWREDQTRQEDQTRRDMPGAPRKFCQTTVAELHATAPTPRTEVDSVPISCFVLCSDAWAGWAHFTTIDFGPISCFKVSKLPRPVMLRLCPQRSGKSGKSGKSNFSKVVFGLIPCFALCSDAWGGWAHFTKVDFGLISCFVCCAESLCGWAHFRKVDFGPNPSFIIVLIKSMFCLCSYPWCGGTFYTSWFRPNFIFGFRDDAWVDVTYYTSWFWPNFIFCFLWRFLG